MAIPVIERVPVEDLLVGMGDRSVDYDWSENAISGDWSWWEHGLCETCGHLTDVEGACENEQCEMFGKIVRTPSGPMMTNSYWPLNAPVDFDPDASAKKIADLPMRIIQISGGEYGLALTSGAHWGWELAEASVRLGFLPPASLEPSELADTWTARAEYVFAAMQRSIEHERARVDAKLDHLDHVRESLRRQGPEGQR